MSEVIVVAGGPGPIPPEVSRRTPSNAPVVAADSGLDHARALGYEVDVVVGDMDSVSSEALAEAEVAGAHVDRFPEEKDQTDLEIALDYARDAGARRATVVASGGGRLDHLLAVAGILTSPAYRVLAVDAWLGETFLTVVRPGPPVHLLGHSGEPFSLVPFHGSAKGVTVTGAAYPLRRETLHAGTGRGVSNRFVDDGVWVQVQHGVLLAVRPEALDRGMGVPAQHWPAQTFEPPREYFGDVGH